LRHTPGSSADSFEGTDRGKWLNYGSKTIQSKSSFPASESKKRPAEERQLMLFFTGLFFSIGGTGCHPMAFGQYQT